ncbi:toxin-antitoxin system YwqK family antitoxin [Dyadobacter chenhuakuii]|uniref:MORN repeat protein n=1 Tax=Dyadobacter chenhuakuii TaxID=2909339 RepID=A0ABY5E9Y1_9BACT|nr:hypothetical protein [Dyadobacter chenhuakuii]UTM21762.1 hypothetical protein NFI80_25565 [Dyadobacter chenhuakuii]
MLKNIFTVLGITVIFGSFLFCSCGKKSNHTVVYVNVDSLTTKLGIILNPHYKAAYANVDSLIGQSGMMIDSRKNGLWLTESVGGRLLHETNYLNDKMHGIHVSYAEDGSISRIEHYNQGQLDGYSVNWADGDIYSKGPFKKGKMDGKWEFYWFGQLARKVEYKDGEPIKVQEIIKMPTPPKWIE